jgi:hypothetical protein
MCKKYIKNNYSDNDIKGGVDIYAGPVKDYISEINKSINKSIKSNKTNKQKYKTKEQINLPGPSMGRID